jgi:uncharacterized protein YkwD
MPVKTKIRKTHHQSHKKERRSKHFLKVYAPYIPLLLIVLSGLMLSTQKELANLTGKVESYATNTTDQGLLDETNKVREAEGLKPLRFNRTLDTAAQAKASDMSLRDYWSHTSPDGLEPWAFVDLQNYKYAKAAENLAYGFITSESTVAGWMNSPGHRANILDPNLEEVGFGIINIPNYQNKGPETLVVAMYGQPAASASNSVPLPVDGSNEVAQTEPKNITYLQSVTDGKAPWSSFAVGIVMGSIIMYLGFKHAHALRRTIRQSERFVVRHPLFDVTLVALIALLAIASKNIGSIY